MFVSSCGFTGRLEILLPSVLLPILSSGPWPHLVAGVWPVLPVESPSHATSSFLDPGARSIPPREQLWTSGIPLACSWILYCQQGVQQCWDVYPYSGTFLPGPVFPPGPRRQLRED